MIAVTVVGTHTVGFQSQCGEDIGEISAVFMVEIIQSMHHKTWIQSLSRKQGRGKEHSKWPFVVNGNKHEKFAATAKVIVIFHHT
jgi:hypothetical protein